MPRGNYKRKSRKRSAAAKAMWAARRAAGMTGKLRGKLVKPRADRGEEEINEPLANELVSCIEENSKRMDSMLSRLEVLGRSLRMAQGEVIDENLDDVTGLNEEESQLSLAQQAYEVLRAFNMAVHLEPKVAWDEATPETRANMLAAVRWQRENDEAPVSASHDSWVSQKMAEGWKYGPVTDNARKESPKLLPFDQLAPQFRAQDFIFRAIVLGTANLPVDVRPVAVANENVISRPSAPEQQGAQA